MTCAASYVLDPAPIRISSAMDVAAELTKLRLDRGWTGEELDARSGLPDRYAAKLENPDKRWGRLGLWPGAKESAMHELWLQTLDMVVVLMRSDQADQIGARQPIKRDATRLK